MSIPYSRSLKVTPYQLSMTYKGRDILIQTAPSYERWAWAAVIDGMRTIGGKPASQPSAQLAIDEGKATIERIIDAEAACCTYPFVCRAS